MELPGDRSEASAPSSLHMAGSDVAMLARASLWSPGRLQFA